MPRDVIALRQQNASLQADVARLQAQVVELQQQVAQTQALAALHALLAQATVKVPAFDPGFAPITLPTPAPVSPVAAFTSPLLTAALGNPLGTLGAPKG